jgi:hypothetical protein
LRQRTYRVVQLEEMIIIHGDAIPSIELHQQAVSDEREDL